MMNRAACRSLYALAVGILILHAVFFAGFTIDDAYITFTYTKNLVKGFGPVFAPHMRVEATSSMLWAVLLTPFEALMDHGAILGSKVLGIIFAICTLATGSILVRRLAGSDSNTDFAPLLFAFLLPAASPFIVWSSYGMENPLVAFLLVLAVLLFLKDLDRGSSQSAFVVFLLQTARPEGFIYIAIFAAIRFGFFLFSDNDNQTKSCTKWFAILGVCLILYEGAGLLFFGHLLPNTVQAKVDGLSLSRLKEGFVYISYGSSRVYSFLLFIAAQIAFLLVFEKIPKNLRDFFYALQQEAGLVVMLCLLLVHWLFVVFVGGDWMRHSRFLAHFIPLLLVLFTVVVWRSRRFLVPSHPPALFSRAVCLIFLNAFMFFWIVNIHSSFKSHEYQTMLQNAEERGLTDMAILLNRLTDTDNAVVACSDVGRLAYFFKGRILDWWGLADEEIASLGQSWGRVDPEVVLRRKPEFIILYSNESRLTKDTMEKGMARHSRAFFQHPGFQSNYQQIKSLLFLPGRWHVLFKRIENHRS